MGRIKIVFVSQSARIAGSEKTLLTLVRSLDPESFEIVVAFSENGPIKTEMERLGIRTALCPLQWWIGTPPTQRVLAKSTRLVMDVLSTARRVPVEISFSSRSIYARVAAWLHFLEEEKPDLVHTNTLSVWESALAARACGIPHIWHAHEIIRGNPAYRTVLPLPLFFWIVEHFSTRIVAVSSWLQEQMSSDVAVEKMSVIENGVDAPPDSINAQEFREKLRCEVNLPLDAIVVLTVATMTAEKGHEVLLEAALEVQAKNKQIHFVIAGHASRSAKSELRKKLARSGLNSHFHYLGARQDVPQLIAAADFVVIPSFIETFSLVLVEAMSQGKAAIATRCGGPQTIARDGESALLIPVGDHDALAKAILRLAEDRPLRERLGSTARQLYLENYRTDIFARHFSTLYREVARENPPVASQEDLELIETLLRLYSISESQILRRCRNFIRTSVLPIKLMVRKDR